MREFSTGATRDDSKDKLNYIKALCPLVLKRYVEYLDRHRVQADGNLRDWDNWKQGIPLDVYMESKGRHFWATWTLHEMAAWEFGGRETLIDSLCAELFNTTGYLFELLRPNTGPNLEVKDANKD